MVDDSAVISSLRNGKRVASPVAEGSDLDTNDEEEKQPQRKKQSSCFGHTTVPSESSSSSTIPSSNEENVVSFKKKIRVKNLARNFNQPLKLACVMKPILKTFGKLCMVGVGVLATLPVVLIAGFILDEL